MALMAHVRSWVDERFDWAKLSDAELTQIVTKGKNKMPAYETKLSKEQITQVVGFVRELAKKH